MCWNGSRPAHCASPAFSLFCIYIICVVSCSSLYLIIFKIVIFFSSHFYIVYSLFFCSARNSLPASSNMVERDAQPGYSKFKQSARQLTDELPLIPMRCPRLCVRHSLISNTCTAYVQLQQTLKVELLAQHVPAPLCFTIQSPKPKATHCLLKTLPPLAHLRCTGSARVAITTFPAYPHDLAIDLDGRCN